MPAMDLAKKLELGMVFGAISDVGIANGRIAC
jgi:hypothetical protein